MNRCLFRLAAAVASCLFATGLLAHSGKARFHLIVDTDCAADDLRALCLLLGNREAEILCIATSEGALAPGEAAARVRALLATLHHEGIPVGAGHPTGEPAPVWRSVSQQIRWGGESGSEGGCMPAADVIAEAIEAEPERVVYLALGSLTNLDDLLTRRPDLGCRIERIVWYDACPDLARGANFLADRAAARKVLAGGIPVDVVSEHPRAAFPVTPAFLDSVAAVRNGYARRIAGTHRAAPLDGLVAERHLCFWDDLAVLYLFAPELFAERTLGPSVRICMPADGTTADSVHRALLSVLRGSPDSESRVFSRFPSDCGLYAGDVAPNVDEAVARHGASEWRAGVLTNELHGHLGIYAVIGVKMGIRAREYFDIGVDDMQVVSRAGSSPPVSCMNDGLQVATGATVGHGLLTVSDVETPRSEALFRFKNKAVRIALKPEYADRIRREVREGVERYGSGTEPYWQYVRELAIRYWLGFDRHAIFELSPEEVR